MFFQAYEKLYRPRCYIFYSYILIIYNKIISLSISETICTYYFNFSFWTLVSREYLECCSYKDIFDDLWYCLIFLDEFNLWTKPFYNNTGCVSDRVRSIPQVMCGAAERKRITESYFLLLVLLLQDYRPLLSFRIEENNSSHNMVTHNLSSADFNIAFLRMVIVTFVIHAFESPFRIPQVVNKFCKFVSRFWDWILPPIRRV
jgi:hypothetical protein